MQKRQTLSKEFKSLVMLILALLIASCGDGSSSGKASVVTSRVSDSLPATASDNFERTTLGSNWAIIFPPASATQVKILDNSDLGMDVGPERFFIVNWRGNHFGANQFSEATISLDAMKGWLYMVFVRWRANDRARYGFVYIGNPSHSAFGSWILKYDGVPTSQTRIIASTPASIVPGPGDTLRIEVEGFTLRGYLNGNLVLSATDTARNRIDGGEVGLAATSGQPTNIPSKVWESWQGGNL